ncbi:MAG: ClpXP protease specificity-enhancing factor SspB [Calditerrivibrio sp.]|nr:ClpXP protease specificity-enhancing factor SspB [Calditerrivibrio sp.]
MTDMLNDSMNTIKKEIFNMLIQRGDKFYMNIHPVNDLIVGKRGLTENEKEMGLLLVFTRTSYKNLTTDKHYICCQMSFNGIWEDLSIPIYAINYIVDDLNNPNFVFKFKIGKPNSSTTKPNKNQNRPNLKIVK